MHKKIEKWQYITKLNKKKKNNYMLKEKINSYLNLRMRLKNGEEIIVVQQTTNKKKSFAFALTDREYVFYIINISFNSGNLIRI